MKDKSFEFEALNTIKSLNYKEKFIIENYVKALLEENKELFKFVENIAYNDIGWEYKWPTEEAFNLIDKYKED